MKLLDADKRKSDENELPLRINRYCLPLFNFSYEEWKTICINRLSDIIYINYNYKERLTVSNDKQKAYDKILKIWTAKTKNVNTFIGYHSIICCIETL